MSTDEFQKEIALILKHMEEQNREREQIGLTTNRSQIAWFEKIANQFSKVDDSFDPIQVFISKTLGIK